MNDIIVTALRTGFPLDLILKATLVLVMAGVVALALHRASAATRHLVWTVGVVGLIVLPLLGLLLPAWEVPVAIRSGVTAETPGPVAGESAPSAAMVGGVTEGGANPGTDGVRLRVAVGGGESPAAVGSAGAPATGVPWVALLLGVYLVGAGLLLLRLVVGWWGIGRLARHATAVTDAGWLQAVKDARWMLDVDRPVALLRSSRASMPMTWGTIRPTILIPEEADGWLAERRRVVLLHEMAHVARRDCLTQTLADIACALYWFHPLSWVAARRLRTERERACDDRVLVAGERAPDYAGHLLEVARAYRSRTGYGVAAIAMARPSQLEGRLLAVLDEARSRTAPGRRASVLGVGFAALLILPLAAIRTADAANVWTEEPSTLLSQLQEALGTSRQAMTGRQGAPPPTAARASAADDLPADSVIDLEIAASQGGTVHLDLRTGGDFRLVGWDRSSVSLHAELRGPDSDDVVLDLTGADGRVTLRTDYRERRNDRSGGHTFELRVPASSNVEVQSAGGNVTIEGVSGLFSGRTGGGDIRFHRASGETTLRTGGGNIVVTESRLDGVVETGGGNVRITGNQGTLQGRTGGGDIRIQNAGPAATDAGGGSADLLSLRTGGGNIELLDVPGGADVVTGGGEIDIRSARGPVTAVTGGGEIRIGSVAGSVDARTGGGGIEVGSAAGTVRLRSGSGDVAVAMAPGAGARDVEIHSGHGSVTLDLPSDFSGSFDIQITGPGNPADLFRSDFDLTTEAGAGRGSPLRATGRTGTGANRVVIRTAGGEVRIRRLTGGTARGPAARPGASRPPRLALDGPPPDPVELESLVGRAVQQSLRAGLEALDVEAIVSAVTDLSADLALHTLDSVEAVVHQEVAREAMEEARLQLEESVRAMEEARRELELDVEIETDFTAPPRS